MRLQFSSTKHKLFGRDKELASLRTAYEGVAQQHTSRLVLLQGCSGTGKSALVYHFGETLSSQEWNGADGDGAKQAIPANPEQQSSAEASVSSSGRRDKRKLFVKGKFDEHYQKPYAAFIQAFGELTGAILRNRKQEKGRIEAIQKALEGDDSRVIQDVIPHLYNLLECESDDEDLMNLQSDCRHSIKQGPASARATGGMLEQQHEFNYRFRSFVRAICNSETQPIVLFCDDLQWADASSLELLKIILMDGSLSNLLIIGSYRCNDEQLAGQTQMLQSTLDLLRSNGLVEIELTLGNFCPGELNDFLADSLEMAPEKTKSLSEVVLRKTLGNIFYSKEFLKHLVSQKLIRYDMKRYQWSWEVHEIAGATSISDNVVDLVSAKIQGLPGNVISILKVASCLWFSFDVAVLEFIVEHAKQKSLERQDSNMSLGEAKELNTRIDMTTQSEVRSGLAMATDQGLLDQIGTTGFKFSHDKIREATYNLIEVGEERDRTHRIIGELLWRMFHSEKSQQWMLFSAADQLNKVSVHLSETSLRVELAEVNLEAAKSAATVSAFLPAIRYLREGIDLLGDRCWQKHYDLCLKLHSKLASLECSTGRFEDCSKLTQETIRHAVTFDDKLPVYATMVESLGVQGKLNESLELAFDVLAENGEHFPNPVHNNFARHVRKDTQTTQNLLKNHTNATLNNLPSLVDKKKRCSLSILIYPAFHTGQMMKLFLIINRMVRITVQFGVSEMAGVAFALYGFSLQSRNGDRKENYRYGKLAVLLQEKVKGSVYDCRVLVYVYVLLNHWQEPLQKSLAPLLAAHSAGMEKGDIDYAFQAAGAFLTLYWYSGNELNNGVNEMRRFVSQMKLYNQDKALTIYLPLFQCMLNISGDGTGNPVLLKGEAISQVEFEETQFTNTAIMSYQMQLAYIFDDMVLASTLSSKLQDMSKSFNAHYLFVARLFFFGMISLRVAFDADRKKRKKNLQVARRMIKEMEQWTSHGGLNCLHKFLILKAELRAFEYVWGQNRGRGQCARRCLGRIRPVSTDASDFDDVREAFDKSIVASTRSGFHNDAALAAERASSFCERLLESNVNRAAVIGETYRAQAIKSYTQWGAKAKVEQMQMFESKSIMDFEMISSGRSSAAHSQFQNTDMTKHRRLSHVGHNSSTPRNPDLMFSHSSILATATEGLTETAGGEQDT